MRSTKEFTRRVFGYIKQMNRDKELPSAAVRVALVIADHWNEESGEAHPSLQTIALESGLGEGTVRRMLPALVERGYLAVQVGSRGSGHPNRYWPLDKSANGGAIESANGGAITEKPKAPFSRIKAPSEPKKAPTGALNTVEHTEHTKKERGSAARSADADRESATTSSATVDDETPNQRAPDGALIEPVEDDIQRKPSATSIGAAANGADAGRSRDEAYAALWAAYPNHVSENDSREVFDGLLDERVDPDMLIAAAEAYAKRCEGKPPEEIRLLCYWLRVRCWEDGNRHWLTDQRAAAGNDKARGARA